MVVTQRVDRVDATGEMRDALDQQLTRWLSAAGTIPVPVPNSLVALDGGAHEDQPALSAWIERVRPQAIVLSGGNNIGECPERDTTERSLLTWAAAHRVPLLGICRGLQMIAVWSGGRLTRVANHVRVRHRLIAVSGAEAWPSEVNSFHNWGLAECPPAFEVAARVEDDGIEAILHPELPWEGWMWHPERETPFSPQDMHRLEVLFGR